MQHINADLSNEVSAVGRSSPHHHTQIKHVKSRVYSHLHKGALAGNGKVKGSGKNDGCFVFNTSYFKFKRQGLRIIRG